MGDIVITRASVADSEAVALLVSDLGDPTSPRQMRQRFVAVAADDDYETLVARDDGIVVGFVCSRVGRLYESDEPYGQVMALAVAVERQRRGIGRMLMRAAESSLLERGVRVLVVTSGNHRADAHAFYERCGYTFTGRRYKKFTEVTGPRVGTSDRRS